METRLLARREFGLLEYLICRLELPATRNGQASVEPCVRPCLSCL